MFFKTFICCCFLHLFCYFQLCSSENEIINNGNEVINKSRMDAFLNLQASAGSRASRMLIRVGGIQIMEHSLDELHIHVIEGQMILLNCPGANTSEDSQYVIWAINGEPFTRELATWRRFIQNNSLSLFPANSKEDYGMIECYIGTEIAGQATILVEKQLHAIGQGLYYYFGISGCVFVTQIIALTVYIVYLNIYYPTNEGEADENEVQKEQEDDFDSDPEDDADESEEVAPTTVKPTEEGATTLKPNEAAAAVVKPNEAIVTVKPTEAAAAMKP